jgi:hypothetical protein
MAHTLTPEAGADLAPSAAHVLVAEAGANLAPASAHTLLSEGGVSLTPSAPGQLLPEGGTSTAGTVLSFAYEMPGDFPVGRYFLLGTSATLGAAWVLEADIGAVSLSGNDLVGAGSVWVQRDGGDFVWSLESSSNWASVSPTVYLQQAAGASTRAECPTPDSVTAGGWLDVINDIDPEDEGMTITVGSDGTLTLTAEGGANLAPAAPGQIVAEGG